MTERQTLLESIAHTIADYRTGEIPTPDAAHVDRWIRQFDEDVQVPLLRELDYVFKQTYFSRAYICQIFEEQLMHNEEFTGKQPRDYWRSAHFLNIQQNGRSQADLRHLFGEVLHAQFGLNIEHCGTNGGDFIYLDDALFTGKRIETDMSDWIVNNAPDQARVRILVIVAHTFGEWACSNRLKENAERAGKNLKFEIWAGVRLENRKTYRHASEVLWPAFIPEDDALRAYITEERKYPFEPRNPGGKLNYPVFSSEEGRQLLEREFLLAGMRIRSFCKNPSKVLRPLGFSHFGLGFGSMIVTYRNCPNNAPLALWWGDPEASAGHPLSKWYPLVPRKPYVSEPYVSEVFFDDIFF